MKQSGALISVDFKAPVHLFKHVADSCQRMIQEHAWSREAHDGPDSLPHFRLVTMDRTFLACSLGVTELAAVQALMGIFKQLAAALAQFLLNPAPGIFPVLLILPAVESYHQLNHPFLPFYPVHLSPPVRSR